MNSLDDIYLKKLIIQVDKIIENYKWLLASAQKENERYRIKIVAIEKRLKTLQLSNAEKHKKIIALEKDLEYLSNNLYSQGNFDHVDINSSDS